MRQAFTMKLLPGYESEYRQRHDAIWPELSALLKQSGISHYSIFLEASTLTLFGVLEADDPAAQARLPEHPVMQKWWRYMSDIMETHADHSPVSILLEEVFYLP